MQLICGGAEWYPYLWIQGGDILTLKGGNPTKGSSGFLLLMAQKDLKR